MKRRTYLLIAVLTVAISACTNSSDSCDDLKGTVTHTDTKITGVESAAVFKRQLDSNVIEAVDQFNGVEFSNLIIDIELSWIEEQHRFRAPNTFIQSMLGWFVSSAKACSLVPFYEDYQPAVTRIDIFSDNDLNEKFIAGSDLSSVFAAHGLMGEYSTLRAASDGGGLLSARKYSLESAWLDDALATTPVTPSTHIFTIMISLDDGQSFEIRTPEVLLSGT